MALYTALKYTHLAAVTASGLLFALRGLGGWLGHRERMMAPGLRYTSYLIDTVLLTAGVGLAFSLQLDPFSQPWLGVKLLLLIVYIVLGSVALKRGRTARVRRGAFLAALAVFLWMIGVARMHHPLGWWVLSGGTG